jgi:hypothetical protein
VPEGRRDGDRSRRWTSSPTPRPPRLWAGGFPDKENARRAVATSVTFGEEWDIPVADLEAAQRYGWPVARADAYPEVFHKERGLALRPPLAWEPELMEGCLRAVPEFVSRRKQDDPAREEMTVAVASGPLKLALSWVAEDGRSGCWERRPAGVQHRRWSGTSNLVRSRRCRPSTNDLAGSTPSQR